VERELGQLLRSTIDDELATLLRSHRDWTRSYLEDEQQRLARFFYNRVARPALQTLGTRPLPPNVVTGVRAKLRLIVIEVSDEILRLQGDVSHDDPWRLEDPRQDYRWRIPPDIDIYPDDARADYDETYILALSVVMSGLCPLWPFCD
jgi:hypothetical protein